MESRAGKLHLFYLPEEWFWIPYEVDIVSSVMYFYNKQNKLRFFL